MKIRGDFFTSIDQSKHLIDLGLNPETADMCWGIDDDTLTYNNNPYPLPWKDYTAKEFYLPCWSLGALMDVMPSGCNLSTPKPMNALPYCCWNQDTEFYGRTSISAAIAMINWLIENNKMCEEARAKGEQKTNDKIEPKFKVAAWSEEDDRISKSLINYINCYGNAGDFTKQEFIAWVEKQHEEKLLNNDKYQTVSVEILDRLYESEKELERLKQSEQKPAISDDALREGIAHFGITQYQIDNWLKKYVDIKKQGEQKPTDKIEPKYKVGDKITNGENIYTINTIGKDCYFVKEHDCVIIPFEYQDKWNLVELKFKVGDWIANGKFTWYIKEFKNNLYRLISSDGTEVCDTISFVKRNFHHWTIKDAKDGDVLVFDNSFILIFKEIVDLNTPLLKNIKCFQFKSYINLDFLMNVFEQGNFYDDNGNKCYPATKEQRDLLFQKMKKAGYEWDADKKELKKIEQKPTEDNCKISDCDTKVDMTEYNNGYECGKQRVLKYPEDFNLCKKSDSVWSEEDEEMTKCVLISLEFFENLGKDVTGHPHPNYFKVKHKIYPNSVRNWLKSLKERMKGE